MGDNQQKHGVTRRGGTNMVTGIGAGIVGAVTVGRDMAAAFAQQERVRRAEPTTFLPTHRTSNILIVLLDDGGFGLPDPAWGEEVLSPRCHLPEK